MNAKQRREWSERETALLRRLYASTPTAEIARQLKRSVSAVYGKADALGLKKSPGYLASDAAGRIQKGDNRGEGSRFKKGAQPHNKGVKGWQAGGKSERTQFPKGQKPHNWKPVGSERQCKDGYLQRKVTDTGYPPRDWKFVHLMLWEQHHGALPKGHMIKFKNGDKRDIRIDNLECISRADNMRQNNIHRLPKALVEVCQLKGRVTRQINKRSPKREQREKQN